MHAHRWLLPFTHGIDKCAIETVIRLAQESGAVVVPVALIVTAQPSARLAHIQQAKDFSELVQRIAARYRVPVERFEVFTSNVQQGITMLVSDLHCDSIVLVHCGEQALLMQKQELEEVVLAPPAPLLSVKLEPTWQASRRKQISLAWFRHRAHRSLLRTCSVRKPYLHLQ